MKKKGLDGNGGGKIRRELQWRQSRWTVIGAEVAASPVFGMGVVVAAVVVAEVLAELGSVTLVYLTSHISETSARLVLPSN
jgi:hypothetical protein